MLAITTVYKPIPLLTVDIQIRFWMYVDRKSEDECWLWSGARSSTPGGNYGILSIKHQNYYANRISYCLHFCDPEEYMVCHECNNPPCVNPKHLFLGTSSDNQKHAYFSGRRTQKGSDSTSAVLIERQVEEIRELLRSKSQMEVAKMFGVAQGTIADIHTGKTWRHV